MLVKNIHATTDITIIVLEKYNKKEMPITTNMIIPRILSRPVTDLKFLLRKEAMQKATIIASRPFVNPAALRICWSDKPELKFIANTPMCSRDEKKTRMRKNRKKSLMSLRNLLSAIPAKK